MMFYGNPADKNEKAQSRKKYYFKLAKDLGVDKEFVQDLFKREGNRIVGGKKLDIGTKIRNKAGVYRKRKGSMNIKKKLDRSIFIKRKQVCTANLTPRCLKVFVTNKEGSVCVRCLSV